ncbi:hypothetical protein [Brassicibacter mesophilus]|uniref:hypothetical protein n=1 Tax=Brassicibacter mesophilus TaxID=745119 RepID=UPI003D1C27E5
MKGFKSILIIILFLFCIFLGNIYYESKTEHVVFYDIIPLKSNLRTKLIDNFFSNDESLKTAARKQIKEIVLKDLEYNNWIDYSDYIEMLIYPIDVYGDSNEELIIALNISKDTGVIGIYKKYNEMYVLNDKIDNLTNINNVMSIKNNKKNKAFIILDQTLDENTGAFFTDNYIQIFTKLDSGFKEVFRQSLDYSAFYYEKWTNPSHENPKWYKITERSVIDNISNDHENITLFISKTILKYKGTSNNEDNIPSDFKLVDQKNFEIKYSWSNKYNAFIIGEGELIANKQTVGILEDTSQTVDYLLNLAGKYYKVIDKNNNVLYISEDEIKTFQ